MRGIAFIILLAIGGMLIQLSGCEPGPLNDYLRPYPTPEYCNEFSDSGLMTQTQIVQDICNFGYGNYNGGGIQDMFEYRDISIIK